MRPVTLTVALFSLASTLHAAPRRRAALPVEFPPCRVIAGTPAVTFSRDGGASVVERALPLHGIGYTYGVAALDERTILSVHNDAVSVSHDSGCTWQAVGRVTGPDLFPPGITAAPGGSAYIWSDNREILARYDGGVLTALKPPGAIVGLGADATRVRVVDGNGTMAAHPADPNVLYFVFGTYFQDYGTDLFRFDAATRELRLMHHDFDDIDAIAFSPADADVMYFGLEVIEASQPSM
jgi:hypothetical protein